MIKIPDHLRTLQEPWLEGQHEDIQHHIRLGHRVAKTESDYFVVDHSQIQTPIDIATYVRLKSVIDEEYFEMPETEEGMIARFRALFVQPPKTAEETALDDFLEDKGVGLNTTRQVPPEAFDMARDIFMLLPEHHLGGDEFRTLMMGSSTNNPYAAHEYDTVMMGMPSMAAKRNFACLLLHNIGHAFYESLRKNGKKRMMQHYFHITDHPGPRLAVDYLAKDPRGNRPYRCGTPEFCAEFYLFY
ncbi:MAG: hypothetical protein KJ601_02295, partial [Nanoarchaeota archaeon]|nr:hypothetical protein [Nanoarchaeota archaeon]